MVPESDHTIDELLRWCHVHGIQIDARIRVVRGENKDISVYNQDALIESGTTLVFIPKTSILSIRNCSLSGLIPPIIYGMEAQLGLALGLFAELLKGLSSPWFEYLQSLPKRVSITMFWSETNVDERQASSWIKGTMVQKELRTPISDDVQAKAERSKCTAVDIICRFYDSTVVPALAKMNLGECATLEEFKHAYALVSSRAFIVDAYHGLAMVPIADAFNHSSENHVHLESDHGVCPTCGSLFECLHDGKSIDDTSGEYNNIREGRTLDADDQSSKELEDTCEMVTNTAIHPFAEVFNTYGERLTNAQLLVRYGFLLDSNENDVISWDLQQLFDFVPSFVFADSLSPADNDRRYDDHTSMPEDHDSNKPVKSFGLFEKQPTEKPFKAFAPEDQDNLGSRAGTGWSIDDKGIEDQVQQFGWGQVLLDRFREVFDLWYCGGDIWATSDLVYIPNDQSNQQEPLQSSYGEYLWQDYATARANSSVVEGRSNSRNENVGFHGEVDTTKTHLRERRMQCSFSLNDEAKMSHPLWVFCALLVLHTKRLRRNIAGSAGLTTRTSKTELNAVTPNIPLRKSEHHVRPRSVIYHDVPDLASSPGEMKVATPLGNANKEQTFLLDTHNLQREPHERLLTSPEADVASLKRLVQAQLALEELCTNQDLQVNSDSIGEKCERYFVKEERHNFAMNASGSTETNITAKEVGLEVESTTPLTHAIERGRIVHPDGARKRTRTSSTESSTSLSLNLIANASDLGVRGRVSDEGERPSRKRREKNPYSNAKFETNFISPEERRRSRRGKDEGINALLQAYESDESASSDVQEASEVGGASRGIQIALSDEDTRLRRDRKSEFGFRENLRPEREGRLFFRDQRSNGDAAAATDAVDNVASRPACGDPVSRLATGAECEAEEQSLNVNSCERMPDSELRLTIASIARVASALCAARVRGMAYPSLDASELGDVIDAIPPTHTQARMAAQLALSERALLQSWAAALSELEHAALR